MSARILAAGSPEARVLYQLWSGQVVVLAPRHGREWVTAPLQATLHLGARTGKAPATAFLCRTERHAARVSEQVQHLLGDYQVDGPNSPTGWMDVYGSGHTHIASFRAATSLRTRWADLPTIVVVDPWLPRRRLPRTVGHGWSTDGDCGVGPAQMVVSRRRHLTAAAQGTWGSQLWGEVPLEVILAGGE